MQEIIQSSKKVEAVPKSPAQTQSQGASPSGSLAGKVEQRFQKQEDELEHLKLNLQTKVGDTTKNFTIVIHNIGHFFRLVVGIMLLFTVSCFVLQIHADIQVIESRLESQERFWRAKLRTVENEYQRNIANLREEFQASLNDQKVERSPTKVKSSSDEAMKFKPAASVVVASSNEAATEITSVERPTPKPKPRSLPFRVVNPPSTTTEEIRVTGINQELPPKVPKDFIHSPVNSILSAPREFEDHQNVQKDEIEEYSKTDESETTSETVGTYSIPPVSLKVKSTQVEKFHDTITVTSFDVQTERDLRMEAVNKPRVEAVAEMNRGLKAIGLNPADTGLPRNTMKRSLKKLQSRRMNLNQVKLIF